MTSPLSEKPGDGPSSPSQSGHLFPDVPAELVPRLLDGSTFTPGQTRQAAQALEHLTDKLAAVTAEYADGQLNQAQFQAIYTRYCDQKMRIERILAADPESTAWKAVAGEGATTSLRQHYAARAVGLLLIEIRTAQTLRAFGRFDLEPDLLVPILSTLIERSTRPFEAGARSTLIEGGRWLTFVPGEQSASIIIFSQEPSAAQIAELVTFHRDFERANRRALQSATPDPDALVYPQEALFPA